MRLAVVLKNPKRDEYFTGDIQHIWTEDINEAFRVDSLQKLRNLVREMRKYREHLDDSFDGLSSLELKFVIFLKDNGTNFSFLA